VFPGLGETQSNTSALAATERVGRYECICYSRPLLIHASLASTAEAYGAARILTNNKGQYIYLGGAAA
jgi:hypothetical protein